MIDVQALAGDSVDNVPGAPGIGDQDRGAADRGVRRPRHAAGAGRRDQAAEAARDADRLRRPDPRLARAGDAEVRRAARGAAGGAGGARAGARRRCCTFLAAMEFRTLRGRVAGEARGRGAGRSAPRPSSRARGGRRGRAEARRSRPRRRSPIDRGALRDPARRARRSTAWIGADPRPRRGGDRRRDDRAPTRCGAELVGIALAVGAGRGGLPAARPRRGGRATSSTTRGAPRGRCRATTALALLRPVLEDPAILKIGQNVKYDAKILARHGIALGAGRRHAC